MIIGFYERTRLKRAPWQALSLVLLVALLCAFFAFFEGFLQQKERDIDTAYDVIPVTLVLSNITGTQTDHLEIFDYEIDYFLSEKYSVRAVLQPRAFSTYVKDVRLKASMYYNAGSGFDEQNQLFGLTAVEAAPALLPVSGAPVAYLDGFDALLFASSEPLCVVPASMLETLTPDADGIYTVSLTARMAPKAQKESAEKTRLRVAGTYQTDSQAIYCPYSIVAALQVEVNGFIVGDSLSATVRNNRELDEFRVLLARHFAEPDPSGKGIQLPGASTHFIMQHSVTIHDETLRATLNALNRNLQTLYRLRPIFAFIEVAIGAIAGFFYFHVRRRELAVARSLGTRKSQVVGIEVVETLLVYLPGLALAAAASIFTGSAALHIPIAIAVLLSMEAGAAAACLTATNGNGIRILREVE